MIEKYSLSETGKRKAEASSGDSQSLRYAIINYIETHGETSVPELADYTNANSTEVKMKVRQLLKEGWLISSGGFESDDWTD